MIKILKIYWLELYIGLLGVFLLTGSLTKEKINENSEFVEINSTLKDYSFIDGRKGRKYYRFYCNSLCNELQIKASYVDVFDKIHFPTRIGSDLIFKVSKNDYINKSDCDKLVVYAIETKGYVLLSLNDVLDIENRRLDIFIPALIILGATIAFLIRYNNLKEKAKQD